VDDERATKDCDVVNGRCHVLPEALLNALAEFGGKVEYGKRIGEELDRALDLMAELSPSHIAHRTSHIAHRTSHIAHRTSRKRTGQSRLRRCFTLVRCNPRP